MMKAKALVPKHNRIRRSRGDIVFDIINVIIVVLITLTMIYPMWYVIIVSFATPEEAVMGRLYIWPKTFTLEAYEKVFENKDIWTGYLNTIIYTVAHTLYVLILTVPPAYALSKKQLPGRVAITWYFFATMFISGGLIPSYMLNKSLGIINSRWIMILGMGVGYSNLVITRTYYQTSIPTEVYESAYIDGCNDIKTLVRIVLPLSLPVLATFGLFYAVGHWNAYFGAMIYMPGAREKWPLQVLLREIIILSNSSAGDLANLDPNFVAPPEQSIKMAVIVVSTVPIMCVYPFLQKYFVKGVMVGALKG